MPYARSSDGIKLYYEEHGKTGTPLVLATGSAATPRCGTSTSPPWPPATG
jgi:hypothetical protein